MTIEKIKNSVIPILKKYGIQRASLFGSAGRNEATETSDVDILVEITDSHMSLLAFTGLKLELEEALGKKVDLGEYETVKPAIKEHVMQEQVSIL